MALTEDRKQALKRQRAAEKERKDAAEEVCWSLMLMMVLGGLEIEEGWRKFLAEPVRKWSNLAVETGVMRP